MKNMMRNTWLVLVSVCMSVYAEETTPSVRSLIQTDGMAYRELKTEVMNDEHAKAKVVERIQDCAPATLERIHAEILLVAIEQPELLEEWNEFIKNRKRGSHGKTHLDRPAVLTSSVRTFVYMGPMSKMESERAGYRLTKFGTKMPNYETVEKYSEKEVKEGIARNAAARWLVAEHLLKFSPYDNDHDQVALVDGVYWAFGRVPHIPVFEKDWPAGETLMRWAMHNDQLGVAARLQALRNLKDIAAKHDVELNDSEINEFLIEALEKVPDKKSPEGMDLTRKTSLMLEPRIDEQIKNTLRKVLPEIAEWKQQIILEETGVNLRE